MDRFENSLVEGQVYTIAGGQVKFANLRYSSIKNDFCLVLDSSSEIEQAIDDLSIQSKAYNFKSLLQLQELVGTRSVDFVGVVHLCTGLKLKQLRNGSQKSLKNIFLCDESYKAI